MTVSNDTITRQDIQIAVSKVNAAVVEAALKVQAVLEVLFGPMHYWIEQAEGSRPVRNVPALPLIVDYVEHPRPLLPSDQPGKGEFWPSQR